MTFPDGTTATGKVDEDGNYTIEIPSNLNLVGGENITASTRDESGNESESTETTVVDATAPDAPTVNDVTSDATQVTGQAEPGSTVTVTFLMAQLLRVQRMIKGISQLIFQQV